MDLSVSQSGAFSPGFRFSDLYVWAHKQSFTGAIDLDGTAGGVRLGFHKGEPLSVTGAGALQDRLGDLLLETGCTPDTVSVALRIQRGASGEHPLLGQLLRLQEKVEDVTLDAALETQTERRLPRLFQVGEGAWKSQPGADASTYTVGHRVDPRSLMMGALGKYASEAELLGVKAALGAWAVKLSCPVEDARSLGADEQDLRIVGYLEHPRLLEPLEAFIGDRRRVRAILRALMLFEMVVPSDPKEAVPLSLAG